VTTPADNHAWHHALVVGAGVVGLTTAITLAESGTPTTIWAADPPEAITSYAAGASWGVHLVAARDRVAVWSAISLDVLRGLATDPRTGVALMDGIEASRTPAAAPNWGAPIDGLRACTPDELPSGYVVGWHLRVPVMDMPVYLGYLRARFAAAGGVIEFRRVRSFDETTSIAPIVVNCTGVGARELTGDADLMPVRGQVVIAENPGITNFFADGPDDTEDLTYFFPHGDTVLLGGTANVGNWSRSPDPATAAAIVARCAAIEPRLYGARIVGHRVGLRPGRPTPRLDLEMRNGARLIHNYGHGGSGVTLAWGCAAEVAALAGVRRSVAAAGPSGRLEGGLPRLAP
jgi:D-amino-acid oxidase